MPLLSYLLIFIALALMAWGMVIKAGNLEYIPGYKPKKDVEVREDELKRFAVKNLLLIGFIDLVIACAMIAMGSDLPSGTELIVFGATILFTLFIVYAIGYASKVLIVSKD